MLLTPSQCRAARALIDWSQQQLADASHVGNATIRNFESGRSTPQHSTLAALQRALEDAGVEFTNDGQPGVRTKGKLNNMTLPQFLSAAQLFEDGRLRSAGVLAPGKTVPTFGFAFVYVDNIGPDLMFEGKRIGQIRWQNGTIVFDPPLGRELRSSTFDDDLYEWTSKAYARHLADG
jgi:transcriptional regulator with XRE-family HTH domain